MCLHSIIVWINSLYSSVVWSSIIGVSESLRRLYEIYQLPLNKSWESINLLIELLLLSTNLANEVREETKESISKATANNHVFVFRMIKVS